MKRWLRPIMKVLVVLVVLMLLLPLIVWAALQNDQVRALAVERVLTDVNDDIEGTVELDRLEGSLIGHARLRGLRITDARGNLAAQAGTTEAHFRLLPLIRRSVVVDEVAADDVTAVVRTYDDEVLNWDLVVEPDPEPTVEPFDWAIFLDEIGLTDGAVAYLDETVELQEPTRQFLEWRNARIEELNDADGADELRAAFREGFDPDHLAALAEPRPPTALWATDLTATADVRLRGHDIHARVHQAATEVYADILADGRHTHVGDVDTQISESTVRATIEALEVDDWIQAGDIRLGVVRPSLERRLELWERDRAEPEDPFDQVFVDLGWWTVHEPVVDWAAPELEAVTPLHLSGDLAVDPQTVAANAEIDNDRADHPVEIAGRFDDWQLDEPTYDATIRAEALDSHHWIDDAEIPRVETTANIHVEGQGFDPEDLDAEARVRFDETLIEDQYGAGLLFAAVRARDGVIDGYNIGALTPYLDMLAAFRFDPDGRLTARARTAAPPTDRPPPRQLDVPRPDRADLDADVDVRFAPDLLDDLEHAQDHLQSLTATASWDVEDLSVAPLLQIDGSSGDADVDVDQTASRTFSTSYDVDADLRGFEFGPYQLGSARISDTGGATVSLPFDEPLEAIGDFENDARLQVTGLDTPEARLDDATAAMAVQRRGADDDRADANLELEMAGLATDELSAGSLRADFDGQLTLGTGSLLVDRVRGQGSAAAQRLTTPDARVGSMETTFEADVGLSPGTNPVETVDTEFSAQARGVAADQGSFDELEVDFDGALRLDDHDMPLRELNGRLEADLDGLESPEAGAEQLEADLDGQFRIPAPGERADPSQATASITARGLTADQTGVDTAEASFDGDLQFGPSEMPLESVEGRFEARAGDIDDPAASIQELRAEYNGSLGLRDDDIPVEMIDGRLGADLAGLATPEVDAGSADLDLETTVRLGSGQEFAELLREFELDGTARAAEIRADEFDAATDEARLTVDVAGTTDNPVGELELVTDEPRYINEQLERLAAGLELFDQQRRGSVYVEATRRDDQRLRAETGFDLAPDFRAGEIFDVLVETERTSWSSNPDGVLRWTGQRAEADDFRFASAHQSIHLDGHLHPEVDQDLRAEVELDARALIHDLYIDQFVPDLPDVAGTIEANLQLDGTAVDPSFEADAQLREIHYEHTGPFGLDLTTDYTDERLDVDRFDLMAYGEPVVDSSASVPVALELDGDYEFFTERHSELAFQIHPRRLRQFHEAVPVLNEYGIDGVAALQFEGAGTIDRPRADLDFTLDDFRVQGEVGDEFLDVRDVDVDTSLEYVPVVEGGEGLKFDGTVDWDDEPAAELRAATPFGFEDWLVSAVRHDEPVQWQDEYLEVPFELIAEVPALDLEMVPLESLRDENLTGLAELDARLEGTVEDPEGHFELDVRDFGYAQFRQITLEVAADIQDQVAIFDRMNMDWADEDVFSGRGTVPLPISTVLAGEPIRDVDLDFHWQLHDTQISRLSAIDYAFARIDGYFGASIDVGGSLRAPVFELGAGIWETNLGDGDDGSIELRATGEDNRVDLEGLVTRDDDPFVTFEGDAPVQLDVLRLAAGHHWQLPGELEFGLDVGPVDLAEVIPTHLVDDYIVDPAGLLDVDTTVTGTWEQPVPSGDVSLVDGGVTIPEIGRGFENINAEIGLTEQQMRVERLEAHDGPSSVGLTGTVEHDHFIPDRIDFGFEADDFNLVGLGVDFPVYLTADATAAGNILGDPGEIDVDVSDLEVVLTDEWDRALHDTDLDPDIVVLDRDHATRAEEVVVADPDEVDGLNLRVNIDVGRNSWARHPAGNVNFQADLQADITGTLVAITGSVEALRGRLTFLGRRFEVMESEISFTGSIPPNPRLRVEAHHMLDRAIVQALGPATTGEPRIEFQVGGTALEPRLTLQSDPAMTDTEILFVLMTGRPPDRTDVGREEGVANQALAAVSGLFFGMLQDELAGTVPVDVLRLEPGVAGARGGRLEVGTYLTNDLFFGYRREFGANEDVAGNIFRLEYHFLPRWMTEVQYTDRNEGELNLYWDVF